MITKKLSSQFTLLFTLLTFVSTAQISFIEDTSNVFPAMEEGGIEFSDIDNDGDLDIYITGYATSTYDVVSSFMINDGQGNFTEINNIVGAGLSEVAFADIDGDNDNDLLVLGNVDGNFKTRLFRNDGSGNFIEIDNTGFTNMDVGHGVFADVDNDNDLDLMLIGRSSFSEGTSELHLNDGTGNFSLHPTPEVIDVYQGEIAFGDVDNDNDLDMVISGRQGAGFDLYTTLYINDGSGNFMIDNSFSPVAVFESTNDLADIDNDGDLDLLLTGLDADLNIYGGLYQNDGSGTFTELPDSQVANAYFSDCEFADFDLDNDQDLVITGASGSIPNTQLITKLYLNDGNGDMAESSIEFQGVSNSSLDVGDVDNDGDLDFIIAGTIGANQTNTTKLYLNQLDPVTNVEDVESTLVEAHPNPFKDFINLDLTSFSAENLDIQLISSSGQTLFTKKICCENQILIPTTNLIPGVYFLNVSNGEQRLMSKTLIRL